MYRNFQFTLNTEAPSLKHCLTISFPIPEAAPLLLFSSVSILYNLKYYYEINSNIILPLYLFTNRAVILIRLFSQTLLLLGGEKPNCHFYYVEIA